LMRLWYSAARSTGFAASWAAAATARPARMAAPKTTALVISTPLDRPLTGLGGILPESLLIPLHGNRRPIGMERHHLLVPPDIDRPAVAPMLGDGCCGCFFDGTPSFDRDLWQ